MTPRKSTVENKTIKIGTVTKLVGENINLKKVADYAVTELELRFEKSINDKHKEIQELIKEVRKFANDCGDEKLNIDGIRSEYEDKFNQAASILGVTDIEISINELREQEIYFGVLSIYTRALSIGAREVSKNKDLNKRFQDNKRQFHLEVVYKKEQLEKYPYFSDYNNKLYELREKYDKLNTELTVLKEEKDNLKFDSKRLHLEVMKSELSKTEKGKLLMHEISTMLSHSPAAKFLLENKQ